MSRLQGTLHAQGPASATTHETEDIFVPGSAVYVDAPV